MHRAEMPERGGTVASVVMCGASCVITQEVTLFLERREKVLCITLPEQE